MSHILRILYFLFKSIDTSLENIFSDILTYLDNKNTILALSVYFLSYT